MAERGGEGEEGKGEGVKRASAERKERASEGALRARFSPRSLF